MLQNLNEFHPKRLKHLLFGQNSLLSRRTTSHTQAKQCQTELGGPEKAKRTLTANEKTEIVIPLEQKVKSTVISKRFWVSAHLPFSFGIVFFT